MLIFESVRTSPPINILNMNQTYNFRKAEKQVAPARSEVEARYEAEETTLPYMHYRRDTAPHHLSDRDLLRREEYYAEDGNVYLHPAPLPPSRRPKPVPQTSEWIPPKEEDYSLPPDSDK